MKKEIGIGIGILGIGAFAYFFFAKKSSITPLYKGAEKSSNQGIATNNPFMIRYDLFVNGGIFSKLSENKKGIDKIGISIEKGKPVTFKTFEAGLAFGAVVIQALMMEMKLPLWQVFSRYTGISGEWLNNNIEKYSMNMNQDSVKRADELTFVKIAIDYLIRYDQEFSKNADLKTNGILNKDYWIGQAQNLTYEFH